MDVYRLDDITRDKCQRLSIREQIQTGYTTKTQMDRSFKNLNKYSVNPTSDVRMTFADNLSRYVGGESALWENTQPLEALSIKDRLSSVGVSPAQSAGSSVFATNIFYDSEAVMSPDVLVVQQVIKDDPESPAVKQLQELRETEQRVLVGQRDIAEAERDLMKYTKDDLLSFYKSRMSETSKSVKRELGLKPFSKYLGKKGDKAELIEDIAKLIGGDVEQVEAEMEVERQVQPAFDEIREEVSMLVAEEE